LGRLIFPMRTVTFLTVYAGSADVAGLDLEDLAVEQLAGLVRKINRRVRKAWKFDRFPELCPTEQRYYRRVYAAGNAYVAPTSTAPDETFYIASGKYYQALKATTGNAPATLTSGAYVVNAAYWAESAASYSGNDWAASTAYALGVYVRNPDDGRYYACHTVHTSGGTFDATKFGILTPFAPYISLDQTGQTAIGEMLGMFGSDPAVARDNPNRLPYTVRASGVVPLCAFPPVTVWIKFRRRVPVFTNVEWSAVIAYVGGDIRYLPASGECYTALQASTNKSPNTEPTYWQKMDFPEVLQNFTMLAAGSDLMRADGADQKANSTQALAYAELNDDRDIEIEGQGISGSIGVETY
jgi:hypothetical protein